MSVITSTVFHGNTENKIIKKKIKSTSIMQLYNLQCGYSGCDFTFPIARARAFVASVFIPHTLPIDTSKERAL